MEFKGTKGKWERITTDYDFNQAVFIQDTENEICVVKSKPHLQLYDALLISKAPEMLEMLNRIHGELMRTDGVLDVQKWGDAIEQLIKEAIKL